MLFPRFATPLCVLFLPVLLPTSALSKPNSYRLTKVCRLKPSAPATLSGDSPLRRNMPRSWRALFGRAERPLSLADELSRLKARFKHSRPAVEAYIRRQPCAEWKPWFEDTVCRTLRDMRSNRNHLQDSETELASPLICQSSYSSLMSSKTDRLPQTMPCGGCRRAG